MASQITADNITTHMGRHPDFDYTGPVTPATGTPGLNDARAAHLFGVLTDLLGIRLPEKTPERWVRAFREMTAGYQESPAEILATTFACDGDELVVLKGIPFVSICEHHLLPFTGTAHVGYLPINRVVGISKLARLVDCFARRLQLQERLTRDIAIAIEDNLRTNAVGVVTRASHTCMECRGVRKSGASMVSSCLLGKLRADNALRAEFMALIR